MKSVDEFYMQRCLQLARCGAGSTSPNPMVGAVIVCDGRIIGEGYHIRAGEPHAEVNAVNSVAEADRHLLSRSTMYVSLEPCSHYGKTPPCCDMIIARGIARVVIGTADPNPQVDGAGIERMRSAGIDVTVGVLEGECLRLNRAFFYIADIQTPLRDVEMGAKCRWLYRPVARGRAGCENILTRFAGCSAQTARAECSHPCRPPHGVAR